MQITFEDSELRKLIEGGDSRKYKKLAKDSRFKMNLLNVYNTLRAAETTADLSSYSFLHYEKLRGLNLSSVRVMNSRVERLIFREIENGIEIVLIELNETHYGKKK